jgi:polyphenol oxidase
MNPLPGMIERIRLPPAVPGPGSPHVLIGRGRGDGPFLGISLRGAGDMDPEKGSVSPSRAKLFERLGVEPERVVTVRQIHSREVIAVGLDDASRPPREADGMITTDPEALLAVTVADCLPLWLADGERGAFGLVHSGWKGTGIAAVAVAAMVGRLGARASRIEAVIGPGIGACCYRVPDGRCAAYAAEFGSRSGVSRDGTAFIDMREANIALLARAGVGHITVVEDCTCCSPELGSFRREGSGAFTRMLAFMGGARAPAPRR